VDGASSPVRSGGGMARGRRIRRQLDAGTLNPCRDVVAAVGPCGAGELVGGLRNGLAGRLWDFFNSLTEADALMHPLRLID
jgi:hypothetical protein